MRARAFEAIVAKAGFRGIEIEAGPVGLVIYGATHASVAQVATQLAGLARLFDSKADAERVCIEHDEPAATRFVATVRFDWNLVQERAA